MQLVFGVDLMAAHQAKTARGQLWPATPVQQQQEQREQEQEQQQQQQQDQQQQQQQHQPQDQQPEPEPEPAQQQQQQQQPASSDAEGDAAAAASDSNAADQTEDHALMLECAANSTTEHKALEVMSLWYACSHRAQYIELYQEADNNQEEEPLSGHINFWMSCQIQATLNMVSLEHKTGQSAHSENLQKKTKCHFQQHITKKL